MHEWALAESVVETVLKVKEKEGLSCITAIKIKLGALQNVEEDIFLSALRNITASKKGIFDAVNIMLDEEEAVFKCLRCGKNWRLKESDGIDEESRENIHFVPEVVHVYVRCPFCGSPDFEVVRGRGVSIDYIEGE